MIDTFFVDAREHLVGKRPDASRAPAAGTGNTAATSHHPIDGSFAWSQLVDSDTLETEIKRIALSLQANLKSPSLYQSGGFGQCRRDFSMLAVLFAVIHQFDEDVRWKRDAAALRDRFARSGFHCKVASEDAFAEAGRQSTSCLTCCGAIARDWNEPAEAQECGPGSRPRRADAAHGMVAEAEAIPPHGK